MRTSVLCCQGLSLLSAWLLYLSYTVPQAPASLHTLEPKATSYKEEVF